MSLAGGSSWSFGGVGPGSVATGTMTGTSKITGVPISIDGMNAVAWTMRWTGTPVGVFSVEVSNEYDPNTNPAPADWTAYTITIPAGTQPAGSAAGSGIDIGPTGFKWIRLCYTNTSSTGVLTSRAHTKGF